mmetsp:Transcript_54493/g.167792  ORF Transcript_54493/g.167792 Transcript_54493/m.167792 type:complete len:203 (-) Transcript_54493:1024-1632(-)
MRATSPVRALSSAISASSISFCSLCANVSTIDLANHATAAMTTQPSTAWTRPACFSFSSSAWPCARSAVLRCTSSSTSTALAAYGVTSMRTTLDTAAAAALISVCTLSPEKSVTKKMVWPLTFTTALPSSVAPKKVQKGTMNWPHAMPHRSNAALGHAASRKMAQKPYFWILSSVQFFMRLSTSKDDTSSSSSVRLPSLAAA